MKQPPLCTPCAPPLTELHNNPTFPELKVRQPNPEKIIDRQTAICQLAKLKEICPKATTLVDMKTNNVFAEPGT